MKLFVVRHGQTSYNVENKVCGSTDADLNETGIMQAKAAAQKFSDIHIDKVYSSPLRRALKTAEIIAAKVSINKEDIIIDKRLSEQDYGIYEGVDAGCEEFQRLRVNFGCKMPGGESPMQTAVRAYKFLDEICAADSSKNVLIVTHGSLSRAINSYFYNMDNDEYFRFMPDNCGILEYTV